MPIWFVAPTEQVLNRVVNADLATKAGRQEWLLWRKALLQIHVRPFDATDLILTQGSCDGEANYPSQWNELARIGFSIFSQQL